jgi:hypothetical protein
MLAMNEDVSGIVLSLVTAVASHTKPTEASFWQKQTFQNKLKKKLNWADFLADFGRFWPILADSGPNWDNLFAATGPVFYSTKLARFTLG